MIMEHVPIEPCRKPNQKQGRNQVFADRFQLFPQSAPPPKKGAAKTAAPNYHDNFPKYRLSRPLNVLPCLSLSGISSSGNGLRTWGSISFSHAPKARKFFLASSRHTLFAPPSNRSSYDCSGSSSQKQTGQISFCPCSSSVKQPQHGQGYRFLWNFIRIISRNTDPAGP